MAAKRKKSTKAPAREAREYVVYLFTKDGKRKTVHTCTSSAEAEKLKTDLAKKYTGNVYGVFWRETDGGGLARRFAPRKAAKKR